MKAQEFDQELLTHISKSDKKPGKFVMMVVQPLLALIFKWAIAGFKDFLKSKGYIDDVTGDIYL